MRIRIVRLAVGAALLAAACPAGAQLIEVERSFAVVSEAWRSLYFVGLPDPDHVADRANSSALDPCDLSVVSPDGVVNADDIICLLWGGGDLDERHGAFTLWRLDLANCRFYARTAFRAELGGRVRFVGTTFAYQPEDGYIVTPFALPGQPIPENRALLRSRCNLDVPPVILTRSCPAWLVSLPYDAIYRVADEALCGIEGIDWNQDSNGNPDDCPAGCYDPESKVSVTVQRYEVLPRPLGGWTGRTVFDAGGLRFVNRNFDLVPGEALLINMNVGYLERTWLLPTEPCR